MVLENWLEHHVLENVRHTGPAVHLVHAAGAVPQHRRYHRCAMILLDQNLQAIVQPVAV
jgi:hypothetical protein